MISSVLPILLLTYSANSQMVITTWRFQPACNAAWDVLASGRPALDAVEIGASTCEHLQCDNTVGYGGSPDENGETTLDAMIMDGRNMNVGAVGCLRNVKRAASVARNVLERTEHSLLVGELATDFAIGMGFKQESLTTKESKEVWTQWKNKNCQPNYRINVSPDPRKACGPYKPKDLFRKSISLKDINKYNHDTIGIIAVDLDGNFAAGTSTNGLKFKIPGRVGDSPIPGAGAYADNAVGAAAGTGDGDVMLRFLPSFLAVELMRSGISPEQAAKTAIGRITEHYPDFMGAVIAMNKKGEYGAACNGIDRFPFVARYPGHSGDIMYVDCEKKGEQVQDSETPSVSLIK